jgi:hypothetical protein
LEHFSQTNRPPIRNHKIVLARDSASGSIKAIERASERNNQIAPTEIVSIARHLIAHSLTGKSPYVKPQDFFWREHPTTKRELRRATSMKNDFLITAIMQSRENARV